MRRFLTSAATALSLAALAAPTAAQASFDSLLGDMDCFGTNMPCADGTSLSSWGVVVTEPDDPPFTDRHIATDATTSWTHTFMPGPWTSAQLTFRTAGIADIAGPYDVFVDGVVVGSMPLDGFGHIFVETFSFSVAPSLVADGAATVSFTTDDSDSWAIDYAQLEGSGPTGVVPEPVSLALLGTGLLGVAAVALRRRREEGLEG